MSTLQQHDNATDRSSHSHKDTIDSHSDSHKDNIVVSPPTDKQSNDLEELPPVSETETVEENPVNNNDLEELPCEHSENSSNVNTPSVIQENGTLHVEPDIGKADRNYSPEIDEINTISQSSDINLAETAETDSLINKRLEQVDVGLSNSVEASCDNDKAIDIVDRDADNVERKYNRSDFLSESSDPDIEDEEENSSQTPIETDFNTEKEDNKEEENLSQTPIEADFDTEKEENSSQATKDPVVTVSIETDSDREQEYNKEENSSQTTQDHSVTVETDSDKDNGQTTMGHKSSKSKEVEGRKWFHAVPYIKRFTVYPFKLFWFLLWAGVSIFMAWMGYFFPTLDNHLKTKTKGGKKDKSPGRIQSFFSKRSDADTETYRRGYPDKNDFEDKEADMNLRFYKNELRSRPDGDYIDDIHKHWKGDYHKLEYHHGYIQWLFPIREHGMNWQAQELQLHEAQAIRDDPKAYKRVLKSYKLMLDFYGMRLLDDKTGKLDRAEGNKWKSRFDNLNRCMHNYLRITRILKSLGELGYEHLKPPFIEFIIEQGLMQTLNDRVLKSCMDYWVGTIRDDDKREELMHKVLEAWQNTLRL